ncbi:MAG TPA: cytochrome c-type biogenesis protein CcmH [Bacillota bacterium]
MKGWWIAAGALVLLAAVALWFGPALGDDRPSTLDEQVREVASKLRCLQCRGQSAWDSNTESSLQMRAEIRRMLEQGLSGDQIVEQYVDRYGSWVLITPPLRGFGALAYVVPAAGLLAGALVLRRLLRAGLAAPLGRPAAGATAYAADTASDAGAPVDAAGATPGAHTATDDGSSVPAAPGSRVSRRSGPSLVDEALRRYEGYDG